MKNYMIMKLMSTGWCAVGAHSHCDGWTHTRENDGSTTLRPCQCAGCRHSMLSRFGMVSNQSSVIR